MNRALLLLLCFFFAASARAQVSPEVPPIYDFPGDDISLALRALARQGDFPLIIDKAITGTVSLRVDNKTPREVFDIIVASKNLVVEERDGILHVRPKRLVPTPLLITVIVLVLAGAALFVGLRFFYVARTHSPK